jgi:putative sigma-54 modulation protein
MEVEYTGRQVTITRALRALADEGLESISKILGKTACAKVVLTSEKYRHVAEVNVFAAKARAALFVAVCESPSNMESALREAMVTAEMQAIRYKSKLRTQKRQPKSEKLLEEPAVARGARNTLPAAAPAEPANAVRKSNGKTRAPEVPVTVHSFPSRRPIPEPHIVRSEDAVALRPMTLEEAVKEAEFRDREVFVFRDNEGNVKVLHRKRDGKMELIEAP